jgi:hypothetical protein
VVTTSGPALADIYNGCHYAGSVSQAPPSNVCHGGVCFGGAAQWQSCLEYPMDGQKDCFGDKSYPTGDARYDTARAVAMHTIGMNNLNRANANCNNFKQTGVSTTPIDPAWTDMSLVPAPYHQYPQTFVYGFLCSGRDLNPNGEDISNSSAAQGWSYLSTISPSPSQGTLPAIYRVDMCTDPEMIWGRGSMAVGTPNSGFVESESKMESFCAIHP